MSLIRKIAVNNAIMITQRGLTALTGFLVSVWLIRHFGSEKFGTYSLVFAWFTFLNVFTPPSIEQVVAREAVRFPGQTRKYLGAGVAIKLALAMVGWVSGIAAAYLLGYPRQTIFYLGIALVGLLGNAGYVLQVPHQVELKLLRPALADGLSNLFYQFGRAGMIVLKLGLLPFFWLYLVFRLLQLAFFLLLGLEKKEYRMDLRFSYAEVRGIFSASWILLINNVFVMVISRIDQLLIYPVWGARSVGLYGSCANLTDYLIMIPSVWYLTVFPLLTRYLDESKDAHEKASHYSFKYLTISAVLLWIAFGGFSGQVISLLFGADYAEAKDALFWLSASMVMVFIYMGLISNAISRGKEKAWLWVSGLGALCNVALNLLLIPRHGIAGAGMANFAAYSCQIVLAGLFRDFRPDFKVMFKSSAAPVALGLLLVLAAKFLQLDMLVWLPVLLAAYPVLLVAAGALNKKDLQMALKAVGLGEE